VATGLYLVRLNTPFGSAVRRLVRID